MINAGKYNRKIRIIKLTKVEDAEGFPVESVEVVLTTRAAVNTTKGFTLISSGSDFESAYTRFTIRFPKVDVTRDMLIEFRGARYSIEYLNNIDERSVELEIQAKKVVK